MRLASNSEIHLPLPSWYWDYGVRSYASTLFLPCHGFDWDYSWNHILSSLDPDMRNLCMSMNYNCLPLPKYHSGPRAFKWPRNRGPDNETKVTGSGVTFFPSLSLLTFKEIDLSLLLLLWIMRKHVYLQAGVCLWAPMPMKAWDMGRLGAGIRDGWEPPDLHSWLRVLEEQQALLDAEPHLHHFMSMCGFLLPSYYLCNSATSTDPGEVTLFFFLKQSPKWQRLKSKRSAETREKTISTVQNRQRNKSRKNRTQVLAPVFS